MTVHCIDVFLRTRLSRSDWGMDKREWM